MDLNKLVTTLYEIGAFKFGEYKLKSGAISPVYFDFRIVISYPELLKSISELIWKKCEDEKLIFDVLCGIPYTALPVATIVSSLSGVPMILKRKESKSYGTKQMVEGGYKASHRCLLIEDVLTTGSSVVETASVLRAHELVITDVVSILDRGQGARENLAHHGITLHSILNVPIVLDVLSKANILDTSQFTQIQEFLSKNLTAQDLAIGAKLKTLIPKIPNANSKKLVQIMEKKKSNLCISFDLDRWWDVLDAVERLGPFICLAKLHLDIYNFDSYEQVLEFRRKMLELSEVHSFMLLEDRKYSDIGSTVEKQIRSKPYEVSKWIQFVTAHGIPGNGILNAFIRFSNISPILIAEMSSEGNLGSKIRNYSEEVYAMIDGYEFVVGGFVAQKRIQNNIFGDYWFLQFTPGISLFAKTDSLGQQYSTIEEGIEEKGADVIIVGRGILGQGKEEQKSIAEEYQIRGWNSWVKKILKEHH